MFYRSYPRCFVQYDVYRLQAVLFIPRLYPVNLVQMLEVGDLDVFWVTLLFSRP